MLDCWFCFLDSVNTLPFDKWLLFTYHREFILWIFNYPGCILLSDVAELNSSTFIYSFLALRKAQQVDTQRRKASILQLKSSLPSSKGIAIFPGTIDSLILYQKYWISPRHLWLLRFSSLQFSRCLPIQEMKVPSLVWEDTLEKEMATYSSILPWEIPWTEELGGLQSKG